MENSKSSKIITPLNVYEESITNLFEEIKKQKLRIIDLECTIELKEKIYNSYKKLDRADKRHFFILGVLSPFALFLALYWITKLFLFYSQTLNHD